MLSILIPVYNTDATPLLKQIYAQLQELNYTDYEVLIGEDGSNQTAAEANHNFCNKNLAFKHLYFTENSGASAVRNKLIDRANGEWLLFLDADIQLKDDFMPKYVELTQLKDAVDIYVGRIAYNTTSSLRSKLGSKTESFTEHKLTANPSDYLLAANFMGRSSVFNVIRFKKMPSKYGFYDRLWALRAEEKGYTFAASRAVVFHLGIESSRIYADKIDLICENLVYIYKTYPQFRKRIRILAFYEKIKAARLLPFLTITKKLGKTFSKWLAIQLNWPFALQVHKLLLFHEKRKENQ